MTDPFLDCFITHTRPPPLVPGRPRREWMDESPSRFAYRCLPMTMANSTGWELLCPFDITIEWDGGPDNESLTITSGEPDADISTLATAHFKNGIVTFHTGYIFRTPPGWGVLCMGPPNAAKDGIYPLSGLIETDWLPFSFTMNWQMTRPGKVSFTKGECFCFITLTEHYRLEGTEPQIMSLHDDPEFLADYKKWRESRVDFIDDLTARKPEAVKSGWQKHYMRGQGPDGQQSLSHQTKRRLKMPVRKQRPPTISGKDEN